MAIEQQIEVHELAIPDAKTSRRSRFPLLGDLYDLQSPNRTEIRGVADRYVIFRLAGPAAEWKRLQKHHDLALGSHAQARYQERFPRDRVDDSQIDFDAAENDERYKVLADQRAEIQGELSAAETSLAQAERAEQVPTSRSPERDVEAALGLLDNMSRVCNDATARADVTRLLVGLGVRIGLSFGTMVKGTKREVQRLLGGVVAFGGTQLPVPIHGVDNREGPAAGD
jgi:hypothetical protein